MRIRLCALLALAAFACTNATDTHRLLIQRLGPSVSAIHIARADGSDERPLLAMSALDYNASVSPDGEWVVFTSERAGSADLYRARVDGSSLERLTDHPAYDDQASWAPDGRSVVFVSTRRSGTTDLWTLDLATRTARNITADAGGDFRPSWSPDGQWIAFSSDRGTQIERNLPAWEILHGTSIYLVRPDGHELRRLTDGDRFAGSPRWSADGRRVVYYEMNVEHTYMARVDEEQSRVVSQIVSLDIETRSRREHTSGPGLKISPQYLYDDRVGYLVKAGPNPGIAYTSGERGTAGEIRNPTWSHDGRLVAYDRGLASPERQSYDELQAMFSGNAQFELAHLGRLAALSLDGCRLAFSEPRGGDNWAIMVMRADGTSRATIFLEKGAAALGPQWSPDGQRIAFGLGSGFETRKTPARIMMMQADGSSVRTLATGGGAGFPSFSPDGEQLVFRVWDTDERGLRILTLESGEVTRLTGEYDTFAGWSPRGDLIAFTRWHDGDFNIYTIHPDGTGLKQLTTTTGNDAHSSWSPDGEYLMFASSRFGFKDEAPLFDEQNQPYGEMFVMGADGTDQRPLTDNQWEDGPGVWGWTEKGCR